MTAFSWSKSIDRAHKHKLKRTKLLINNPDFKKEHPDEARDGNSKNWTKMNLRLNKEMADRLQLYENRQRKIAGLPQK